MTHAELVQAIKDYCRKHGDSPEHVSRDRFRSDTGIQVRSGWTEAKSEASGGKVPGLPVEALPPGHTLKGVSSLIDGKGNVSAQWVKTTAISETPEALLARLLSEVPASMAIRESAVEPPPEARDDLMAVYPMGDPHIGMMAWAKESGADFDLKIAEDLTARAIRDLVLRGPATAHALLVNLGDFFHSDNADGKTTKGQHSLDSDGRAPKVLAAGLRIIVHTIDALLEHHRHVTVDCRIGNHDGHTSLMLSLALGAYYRNEPRVTIPPTIAHRRYLRFGQVLIGTTHGDRAKMADLGSIMAAEAPADWGASKHRVWLCGHVHHKTVTEYRGVTVETFRTLAARDSWHAAQGYVSGRDMTRIVYHREHGEISREVANVGYLLAGAAE